MAAATVEELHVLSTISTSGAHEQSLSRPCVDCGLCTGNFCETLLQQGKERWQGGVCYAENRVPTERWAPEQRTPLCTHCERKWGVCHFCRGQMWCVPPAGVGYGADMRAGTAPREEARQRQ